MLEDPVVSSSVRTHASVEPRRVARGWSGFPRLPLRLWLWLALVGGVLIAWASAGGQSASSTPQAAHPEHINAAGGVAMQQAACAGHQGTATTMIEEFLVETSPTEPLSQLPVASPTLLSARYRTDTKTQFCDATLYAGIKTDTCASLQSFVALAQWPANLIQPRSAATIVCLPAKVTAATGGGFPFGLDPASTLNNLLTSGLQGFFDEVKTQFIDWASSFGFLYITPGGLTYKLGTIKNASRWVIGILDGAVALLLVVGGYNVIMRHHLDLPASGLLEVLPRLALVTIIANVGFFYVLPQLIELNNSMCTGVWMAFGHAGMGDFTLPLGLINWLEQPLTLLLFGAIDFLISLLLVVEQLVRIGLIDVLIVFAPLGIMCAALPQTRVFFRLWVISFFCTLFVQFLQVGTVALGSALIVSFGHASNTPVVILVGIATVYAAFKLPGMLLSNVLRTTVGSVRRDGVALVTHMWDLSKKLP